MTFRQNAARQRDDDDSGVPGFVRGADKAPSAVGDDDLAWAIARQISVKFFESRVNLNKSDAWLYHRVKSGLDKTRVRAQYGHDRDRFRDGTGKLLPLPEFGRRAVNYFWKHAPWAYESSAMDVVSMFCDPVTLDNTFKALQRVYKNRRAIASKEG